MSGRKGVHENTTADGVVTPENQSRLIRRLSSIREEICLKKTVLGRMQLALRETCRTTPHVSLVASRLV